MYAISITANLSAKLRKVFTDAGAEILPDDCDPRVRQRFQDVFRCRFAHDRTVLRMSTKTVPGVAPDGIVLVWGFESAPLFGFGVRRRIFKKVDSLLRENGAVSARQRRSV